MSLTFEPLLPPAVWVALVFGSAGLLLWYALRRPFACRRNNWWMTLALSAAALSIVLAILMNPVWLNPVPPPAGKPLLSVVVDTSRSMAIDDARDSSTRLQAAVAAVRTVTDELSERFDIRISTFAGQSTLTGPEQLGRAKPAGMVSDLSQAIGDSLVSDRPQGQAVLLISDGGHNAPGPVDAVLRAAESARLWNAPLYTVTLGRDVAVNDLEVRIPRSQELAFAGQTVPVAVDIVQHGQVGQRAAVTLTGPDGEIAVEQAELTPNGTAKLSFLIDVTTTGLYQYQFQVDPLPGEATADNNHGVIQIRVVDEPVNALVLEGKPYWDGKFLLRMLADDPALNVNSVVRITDERFLHRTMLLTRSVESEGSASAAAAESTSDPVIPVTGSSGPGTPDDGRPIVHRSDDAEFTTDGDTILSRPDELRRHQILLLGREAETWLTQDAVENIRNWIARDGGSLVCYRGSPVAEPDQKLSRLLPVRWQSARGMTGSESRFRIQVTERGDDLTWLRFGAGDEFHRLPSLVTKSAPDSIQPLAVVLGRGAADPNGDPVLTYQPYGMGKVVVVEGAGMWRWAFLPPEYQSLDPVYGTLWQSLLRWLVSSHGLLPGETMSLQMDQVTFTEGESVSAFVLRRPDAEARQLPEVELLNEDGALLQSVSPAAVGDELGVYQVFLGALAAGRYEVRLKGEGPEGEVTQSVRFLVRPDLRETLQASARPDLMKRLAELGDGAVIPPDRPQEIGDLFEAHLQQTRAVQYERSAAWDRWWVLCTVLTLWGVSWGIRRRSGLI